MSILEQTQFDVFEYGLQLYEDLDVDVEEEEDGDAYLDIELLPGKPIFSGEFKNMRSWYYKCIKA